MCLRHKQYDWYSSDTSILGLGPFFKHLSLGVGIFDSSLFVEIFRDPFYGSSCDQILFYIEYQSKRTDNVIE